MMHILKSEINPEINFYGNNNTLMNIKFVYYIALKKDLFTVIFKNIMSLVYVL